MEFRERLNKFKESLAHKYSKQEVIDYLVKGGSNIENAKRLVDKNWDYIHRVYDGQNLTLKGVNDLIRNLGESFKEQAIPMVVEEASRMFYQGFEIGAVKARLKDKYPSISIVDINDSVDRAFSDVGSKEESFKKLKEKFIKKESLTLDDVALEKYGKRFKDLTSEEKKYVNYVYAEWTDDSYDEACKREGLTPKEQKEFNKLRDDFLGQKIEIGSHEIKRLIELEKKMKESYKEKLNYKLKVPTKDVEQIRVLLNRDLGYKFTYFSSLGEFSFSDTQTRDKAYDDLMTVLSGNYNKDLRDSIKKESFNESFKEGYVQITGPFNIPKTKARLQQLCNDFGLQMTSDGRIDFNDNRSLLKREINELLGELKNLGVSYRLVESYKERLNKLNKK